MQDYRGRIVTISDYMLKGWAIRPGNLDNPVCLELQVDGEEPVEVVANQFSASFGEKLGTDGKHFFRVPVPMPHLLRGRSITARIAGTDLELTNSPFVVDEQSVSQVDESALSYFNVVAEDGGAGGSLVFKNKAVHNARLSTLLFIANPMSVASGAILAKLAKKWMREDSVALSSKNLFLVQYTPSPGASTVDLISKIDPTNKQILETYQNLVFIDPQDNLASAVRASSSNSRLFVVLSPNETMPDLQDDRIDALVVPYNFDTRGRSFARVIRYDPRLGSTFPAARALKRLIREAQPRAINAFFQVYGARGRKDLPWTLSKRHDVVIVAEPSQWHDPEIATFAQYLLRFATRVKALYVSEEFYLRYRTLVDVLNEDPARLATLVSYALEDGSRIDVRH